MNLCWLAFILLMAGGAMAKPLDYCARAQRYARWVVAGKIPACLHVQNACERQLRDLKQKDFAWQFDRDRGNKICKFMEMLPHVKGRWPSKTIIIEDWQCFNLSTLFGWVDADGYRRFRRAYWELPRKNTKTTECAGIGLYLFAVDEEPGAEIYSAAVTRDQAKIAWGIADKMVRSKQLAGYRDRYDVTPYTHHMERADGSVFRPLSRDADSLEGLNVHGGIVDELHAHKTREVYDVIDSATGSRKQPLLIAITTAGSDVTGIGHEQHDYTAEVLARHHVDNRHFGIIYGIDREDDWTTDASARKANPNLGISIQEEDLFSQRDAALKKPAAATNYKTKRLNVWVATSDPWFNMMAWEACRAKISIEDCAGWDCWFALDAATKVDIAAMAILFRRAGKYALFGRYYVPDSAIDRGNPNYDFYRGWSERENFIVTPGNVIDFEFIEADMLELGDKFHPREVAFDPWQTTELSTRMQAEGLLMVEVGPTVRNFSEPMKELDALMLDGNIQHDGDPALGWMLGNVTAELDRKDNVYPRKEKPEKKIDGAVAALMTVNRALVAGEKKCSVYDRYAASGEPLA